MKDADGLVPPEAVRLFKKAMKQRRGSVDNVAETLMSSLTASGESKENVLQRLLPYFQNDILSSFDQGKFPIVVTHKHCMRVLMKYYLQLSDEVFETYKIPSKHIVQMNFDKNYKLLEHKFIPFIET